MRQPIPKIRLVLNLLLIIEVFLGIALAVITFYYQHILSTFMTEVESEMLSAKFFNTYVLGFQLIASYSCGMALWNRIWPRRYSENVQLLLSIWLFFCFLIVVCGCATIWSLQTSGDALAESAELMLYKGIDIYYINPEWKLLWDQLQYLKECCGVHSYQDWMYASWMPQNIKKVASGSSDHQYGNNNGNGLSDCSEGEQSFAPYACCKHDSVSCYQNYVPRTEDSASLIPHLNITDINTEGCLSLFTGYMWRVMNILCIIIFSAIVIDIVICCLTRYIMSANECSDYSTLVNDMSMFDEDGNALVVIKCPPNVKCITMEEQINSDSDLPNIQSSSKACICCNERRPCSIAKEKCGQQNNNYILH